MIVKGLWSRLLGHNKPKNKYECQGCFNTGHYTPMTLKEEWKEYDHCPICGRKK